eukprot:XP_006384095.2 UDP-glycosyltransferase 88A1 [Populus trichocarpa]
MSVTSFLFWKEYNNVYPFRTPIDLHNSLPHSTLEAVCAGVPLVAWPLYAEQTLNRAVLVEEMKLALSMNESEDGFVSADEVEKNLRGLMVSDEGILIKERALTMKNAAKAAMIEGGSSHVALSKLVESWN